MPWTAMEFEKKNHSLDKPQAKKAAHIANAILEKTGDEGMTIAVANKQAKKKPAPKKK